ncbi:MAG: Rid family hydrolase, partial [Candidatus Binatia bacterium]
LSEDFAVQLKQAVRNTEIVLAAAGAKMSDVAKFTLYVVDHDNRPYGSGGTTASRPHPLFAPT